MRLPGLRRGLQGFGSRAAETEACLAACLAPAVDGYLATYECFQWHEYTVPFEGSQSHFLSSWNVVAILFDHLFGSI